MPNYANSCIYKLLKQDDYDNKNIYIGSTTNFRGRKNCHKNSCITDNPKYNIKVYQFIRDNGGWEQWTMIQLEAFPCETKKELETRERYWIEQMKPVLNCMIPTRTKKEWQTYNKEKIQKQRKYYRDNNKEKITEISKIYRENNKEQIYKTNKQYYENNKEINLEKAKIYRENNKEKGKEYRENNKEKIQNRAQQNITCECGCILYKKLLNRHKKTQKHIKLMEEKNNIIE